MIICKRQEGEILVLQAILEESILESSLGY